MVLVVAAPVRPALCAQHGHVVAQRIGRSGEPKVRQLKLRFIRSGKAGRVTLCAVTAGDYLKSLRDKEIAGLHVTVHYVAGVQEIQSLHE